MMKKITLKRDDAYYAALSLSTLLNSYERFDVDTMLAAKHRLDVAFNKLFVEQAAANDNEKSA